VFVRPQEDYLLDRRPGVSTVMCEPRRTNGREASPITWCGELEVCFNKFITLFRKSFVKKRPLVIGAAGVHPVPSRTRKLSPLAPMVLGWRRPGRVGHCQGDSCLNSAYNEM
jgi:hypothetical protein